MNRYTYKITYLDPRNLAPRDIFCSVYSKTTKGCKGKIGDFMEKEVKNWEGAYETKLVDEIKVIHRSDCPSGIVYVLNTPILEPDNSPVPIQVSARYRPDPTKDKLE